ncbi:MAG: hypothetical protein ACR2MT_17850 [Aurantibacter sp.]
MKKYVHLSLIAVFTLFSCETDTETGEESVHEWPSSISGCNININLEDAEGASVEAGLTIRYTFSLPSEQVSGVNPENGATYTADSYSYDPLGNKGVVTLFYGQAAFEEYTLTPNSETGGTYTSESFNGAFSASSSGTYTYICF